jgi:group II intron maturase
MASVQCRFRNDKMATRISSVSGKPIENSTPRSRRALTKAWLHPAESERASMAWPPWGSAAREWAAAALAPLGLRLHPDKTTVVCLQRGEQGFDFLGFHHRMVESLKWRGRWYLNKWPSKRAMARIRTKVRERTPRRYASLEMRTVAEQLNPVLRGWGNYYRWGNSNRKFQQVDSYVHERLAMLASIKHSMRFRRNWASRFDVAWLHRQGVYRLTGTVRQWPAHA